MDLSNMSEELMNEARACKTPEELLNLAKREGVELSDEEIQGITGGQDWCGPFGCTKVKLT